MGGGSLGPREAKSANRRIFHMGFKHIPNKPHADFLFERAKSKKSLRLREKNQLIFYLRSTTS